jgi:hypothetical protein
MLHYPVIHNVDANTEENVGSGGVQPISTEDYLKHRSEAGLPEEDEVICVICFDPLYEGLQQTSYSTECSHCYHSCCVANLIRSQAEDISTDWWSHQLIRVGSCALCKAMGSWMEKGNVNKLLPDGVLVYGVHKRKVPATQNHWYSNYITDPGLWYILCSELPSQGILAPFEYQGEKTESQLMDYFENYFSRFESNFDCALCGKVGLPRKLQVYSDKCPCALMCQSWCLLKIQLVTDVMEKKDGKLTCVDCNKKGRMKNHVGIYVMNSSPILRRSNKRVRAPASMIAQV